MADREEYLKLIISGDGKLLGTELDKQERRTRTFGNRVGSIFNDINRKMMSGIKNLATNPLTIFGGAAGIMYAGKQLIEYKDILSTVGINAGMTDAEIVNLDKTMQSLAYKTGQDRDKLTSAFGDIIDKTGDVQFAIESMYGTGRASTGMSTDIMDTSRVVSSLRLGLRATAEDIDYYMDVIARMGNVGSFTFAQQASQAERLFSASVLAAGIQKKNFAEYNAFMQSVKPMFGSPDEAGTAIQSIMSQLKSDSKIQKALGFKLFDEKGAIIDFEKTIKAIAKLSPAKRTQLFGEYARAFNIFDTDQGMTDFEKYIQVGQKAGFISEAFARKQKEAKYQLQTLTTLSKDFASSALLPTIQSLTVELSKLTSDPSKLKEFTENITNLAKALGWLAKYGILQPIQLLAPLTGIMSEDQHRKGVMEKWANQLWKNLPKSEQRRLSPMVEHWSGDWDNSKYSVLKRWRPDLFSKDHISQAPTEVKNDININLQVAESGRVSVSSSGNASVKINRGNL